ncbi:MAG TPA: hypothetical protein ENF76_06450 [Candidatus Bathyarchaeota archaeon]|nr:hypothetical protein [Candidatus Bathyarchaeota archaeon]
MRKNSLKIATLVIIGFFCLATITTLANAAVVAPVDRYGFGVALFKDADPWGYPANEIVLKRYGIPYDLYNSTDIGNVDLSKYAKVVIASDQPQEFYDAVNVSRAWFEEYVEKGGVLEIHAADLGWNGGSWVELLPGGINYTHVSRNNIHIELPSHPIVRMPNNITDSELDGWSSSAHGYFISPYPPEYIEILNLESAPSYPVCIEVSYGNGTIIASTQTLEFAYGVTHEYGRPTSVILENFLLYLAPYEELNMEVNVGTVHFRGEIAEFYVKTSLHGNAINASIWDATLYYENGTQHVDLLPNVEVITIGLYRITYTIPANAPTGTYTLSVKASFRTGMTTATGHATASFVISPTLTAQNAYITEIKDNIATIIIPDLGTIKANLTEIDAKVTSIDDGVATIQTDLGTIKTDVSNINAKVTSIDDGVATIETDLGTVKASVDDVEALVGGMDTTTQNTYWFSIAAAALAALAAVIAIIVAVLVKKKPGA